MSEESSRSVSPEEIYDILEREGPYVNFCPPPNYLLKNFDTLNVKCDKHLSLPYGHMPSKRPLEEYLKYGFIPVDKPADMGPEVLSSYAKEIFNAKKVRHSETLNYDDISGCFIIFLNNATKVHNYVQQGRKEYVINFKLDSTIGNAMAVKQGLRKLQQPLFKLVTPSITKYKTRLLRFDEDNNTGSFWVSCLDDSHILIVCTCLSCAMDIKVEMVDIKRIRLDYHLDTDMSSISWLFDADIQLKRLYKYGHGFVYVRRLIKPIESLLTKFKRIFIKDTAINNICCGANVFVPCVLRYENGIKKGEEVVLVSTKGEAVAMAVAEMTSNEIELSDHGLVAKLQKNIMDQNTYPTKRKKDRYGNNSSRNLGVTGNN